MGCATVARGKCGLASSSTFLRSLPSSRSTEAGAISAKARFLHATGSLASRGPSPALLEILLEPKTIQRGYLSQEGLRRKSKNIDRACRPFLGDLASPHFELWHRNFLESATRTQSTVSPCASLPRSQADANCGSYVLPA